MRPAHGFAAIGLLYASDDSAARISGHTSFPPVTGSRWILDGNVFVSHHLALGVEAVPLGTLAMLTESHPSFGTHELEREYAVFGVARWRIVERRWFAVDASYGLGALYQHREIQTRNGYANPTYSVTVEDLTSRAWFLGADLPFETLPHLILIPSGRAYVLNRGSASNIPPGSTSSTAYARSVRWALAGSAGVRW